MTIFKRSVPWIVLVWLLTCKASEAATYYVSKTGSDSHACSQTDGAATNKLTVAGVAGGISCLSSGDTLVIHTGTYTEAIAAGKIPSGGGEGSRTFVKGATGETVTLNGVTGGYTIYIYNKSYITIQNVNLLGNSEAINVAMFIGGDSGGGFSHHITYQDSEVAQYLANDTSPLTQVGVGSNHHLIYRNLRVHHNGLSHPRPPGSFATHGIYITSTDSIVEGCEIYNNNGFGIHNFAEAGGVSRNTFRGNRIHDNFSYGILLSSGDSNVSYNNEVYRNGTTVPGTGGIWINYGCTNCSSANDLGYANTGYGIRVESGQTNSTVKNFLGALNTVANLSGSPANQGNNFITATANCFVNGAAGNFLLVAGCGAIDSGADLSSAYSFTTDTVGVTRPQLAAWDAGPNEFRDTTPPNVTMTGPANGATVSGQTVAVKADASDNVAVVGVQFKIDGINLGVEDTVAPYCMSWNSLTATNALHTLIAVARDAAGNTKTSAAIAVTVNNGGVPDASPTVSITSPANGQPVTGTITVSADAHDDVSVSGVQFKLDGANLGAEDTSFPYGVSWATTSVGEGLHTLMAVARDGANHTTQSTSINVTVSNPPPTISGISAGSITTSGATIVWTTSTASDSQVEYGTTTAYGSSSALDASLVTSHSRALTGLATFTLYHYRVKSRDINGQLATSGDNTFTTAAAGATTLTITFPAGGETWIKGQVKTITWTKSSDVSGNVRLLISRNGGSTFKTIVNSVAAGALSAPWTVTAPSCSNCLIRINSLVNPAVFDNSATFIIKTQP